MQTVKPGWQSSEIVVGIIGVIVTALNKRLGLDLSPTDVMTLGGIVVAYIANRAAVKSAAHIAAKPDATPLPLQTYAVVGKSDPH